MILQTATPSCRTLAKAMAARYLHDLRGLISRKQSCYFLDQQIIWQACVKADECNVWSCQLQSCHGTNALMLININAFDGMTFPSTLHIGQKSLDIVLRYTLSQSTDESKQCMESENLNICHE